MMTPTPRAKPSAGPARVAPPELWAGFECSVVRVRGSVFDQVRWTGLHDRPDDLDRVAGLGVKALRFPVLWERTAPDGPDRADWSWADDRLGRLRRLGVRPVVGLVHHGSGPLADGLLDASFADGLAAFAAAVAGRYPWVGDYTPVNEPLTTARFAGLYGHWHPHGRDDRTFVRALLHECRATALAMQAVRRVNPAARLVQTEDLGKTHATPPLAPQAEFENERRWLSYDLLCGRVDRSHPLHGYLHWAGATDRDLGFFLDHPCVPDVFGFNHYLTSERFLDHRTDLYPAHLLGGNGRQTYADVEAVRVRARGLDGPGVLLREAWERYRRPLAVTEAHLACDEDEQVRWFHEVWLAAESLRAGGADVRAVTAWAVLGAFDWDGLMTLPQGRYEPGVFDVRGGEPRPTPLAGFLAGLSSGRGSDHPALDAPGWWRRADRLAYPPPSESSEPGPGPWLGPDAPFTGRSTAPA